MSMSLSGYLVSVVGAGILAVTAGATDTLPSGYVPVKFVETQFDTWVDSGYVVKTNTVMEAELAFGGRGAGNEFICGVLGENGTDVFAVNFGGQGEARVEIYPWLYSWNNIPQCLSIQGVFELYKKTTLTINKQTGLVTFGSLEKTESGTCAFSYTDQQTVILCGCPSREGHDEILPFDRGTLRVYRWKFFDGDLLCRDFVPCKRIADGVAGLYDLAGSYESSDDGFYPSLGTAPFAACETTLIADLDARSISLTGENGCGCRAAAYTPAYKSLTANVWVKNVTTGQMLAGNERLGILIGQGAVGLDPGYSCFLSQIGDGDMNLVFQYYSRDRYAISTPWKSVSADIDYTSDNIWHMTTISFEMTDFANNKGTIRLYIDGQLKASQSGVPYAETIGLYEFCVGYRLNSPGYGYQAAGLMAEPSLWSRALTDKEVLNLYNKRPRGTEEGLVGFWPYVDATTRVMPNCASLDCAASVITLADSVQLSTDIKLRPVSGLAIYFH